MADRQCLRTAEYFRVWWEGVRPIAEARRNKPEARRKKQ